MLKVPNKTDAKSINSFINFVVLYKKKKKSKKEEGVKFHGWGGSKAGRVGDPSSGVLILTVGCIGGIIVGSTEVDGLAATPEGATGIASSSATILASASSSALRALGPYNG